MRWIFLLIVCLALEGCLIVPDYDPHQLFINQTNTQIGRDIRGQLSSMYPPGVMLDTGLIEMRQKNPRVDCVVYYQYDPKTFIIKSWRWEGAECVSNP